MELGRRRRRRRRVNHSYLPEDCVSIILSYTTPRDACRLALVSSTFRSAAESDVLWEKFLPSDYQEIVSGAVAPLSPVISSKKDLYFHLCNNHFLVRGGKMSFRLEKCSGKKCYMIGARELRYVFQDVVQLRNACSSDPESRFPMVAELEAAERLLVIDQLEIWFLSPQTVYAAYLVFQFKNPICTSQHRHIVLCACFRFQCGTQQLLCLTQEGHVHRFAHVDCDSEWKESEFVVLEDEVMGQTKCKFSRERDDGWLEIMIGVFVTEQEDRNMKMTIVGGTGTDTGSGIIIQGIEYRPK